MSDRYVNSVVKDDNTYFAEYIWRDNERYTKDANGRLFPKAEEGKSFGDSKNILNLLTIGQMVLKDFDSRA